MNSDRMPRAVPNVKIKLRWYIGRSGIMCSNYVKMDTRERK
jgi:hypothetical protein